MISKAKKLCVLASVLVVAACSKLDHHAENFQSIAIGDSRTTVIHKMGQPDEITSLSLPLLDGERLVFHTLPGINRKYVFVLVQNTVVSKSVQSAQ